MAIMLSLDGAPLLLGDVLFGVVDLVLVPQPRDRSSADWFCPIDLTQRQVRAIDLARGQVLPSWPDGVVTKPPMLLVVDRVGLEISGADAVMCPDELVAVARRCWVTLPRRFVRAALACFPTDLPAAAQWQVGLDADSDDTGEIRLQITGAELLTLSELAPMVWWECQQAVENAEDADTATAAGQAIEAIGRATVEVGEPPYL